MIREACAASRTEGTNIYLTEERAIEEFLKEVEPSYNISLEKLRADKVDRECILSIAGFVAYVATCSPAAMRINSAPLHGLLKAEVTVLDSMGMLPKAPPSLGEKSLTDLIEDGTVRFDVDPKYPQGASIRRLLTPARYFPIPGLVAFEAPRRVALRSAKNLSCC